jgi:ankyrin repeat protein
MNFQTYLRVTSHYIPGCAEPSIRLLSDHIGEQQLIYLATKELETEFSRQYRFLSNRLTTPSKHRILERIINIRHLEPISDRSRSMARLILHDLVDSADSVAAGFLLPIASLCGNYDIVKEIVERNIDCGAGLSNALIIACFFGHVDIARVLLKDRRINPSVHQNTAVMASIKRNHLEVLKLLLQDDRVNPMDHEQQVILTAVYCGSPEVIRMLLEHPLVDPTFGSNHLLTLAVARKRKDIVQILLQDSRIDPSIHSSEILVIASHTRDAAMVKLLLDDNRVDPRTQHCSPLRIAASLGDVEMVKILMAHPTMTRDDLSVVYEIARQYNHVKILDFVLQNK